MCSLCPRARRAAPASFTHQQSSPSTRSASLVLAVFCLLAALSIFFVPQVEAQTAHFSGAQTALGSGLSSPFGVAVDGVGNVYVADTSNNRVLKETLSGASYVQIGCWRRRYPPAAIPKARLWPD